MLIKSKVLPQYNGSTLAAYLAARFTYLSLEEWLKRIQEQRFSRNDTILQEDDIVTHHEVIEYQMPDFTEDPADLNYQIVRTHDEWLAVDKPGNLLVHKKGRSIRHNLIYQLRECHQPPFPTADIVNRLDRETSGLVLIALNKDALRELNEQFAARTVRKCYYAVCVGILQEKSGVIDLPIGIPADAIDAKPARFWHSTPNAREAITQYEVVAEKNGHSLVKLSPQTGRTHQLRVHLAAIGTPILGDALYGMGKDAYLKFCEEAALAPISYDRHCLHCFSLTFQFGKTEEYVSTPVPQSFTNPFGIESI